MKKVKYLFLMILLFTFFSCNVIAETINNTSNIVWHDSDNSNSVNVGDEVSVVYKTGASDFNVTQQFYVLKNEGKYTYLFSKYNLNVGTYKTNSDVNIGITAPSIRAWVGYDVENYGPVTQEEMTNNLNTWLNDYKNELKNNYNLNVENVSLLSREDAINYLLLTSSTENMAYKYNSDKYGNTSYWLNDMYDSSSRYFINGSNNTIDKQADGYSGIRPVVKVQTKYLNGININYVKPQNISSSKNDLCLMIDNLKQCFTFLKKGEDNTNYYLANYNLNVGYYYNQTKKIGTQDSSIRAWVDDSTPNYGRVSYKTATVYFQDYKDRIFNSGYNILSINYLSKKDAEEAYSLTHFVADSTYSITTAFNDKNASLYANTTYWLKDGYNEGYNYYINSENKIGVANDVSGIRPVIQLAALDITNSEKFNSGEVKYNKNDSTISVYPDEGYELDKLYILNSNGEYLNYTKIKTNVYKFTEENWNVNISATFKAKQYEIINGADQIFKNNSLEFELNAPSNMISNIYINNNVLDSKYFKIIDKKIILDKDYLNTLKEGTHSLKITYKNNTFNETNFIIKNNLKEENPNTNDPVIYYIVLIFVSFVSCILFRKNKLLKG